MNLLIKIRIRRNSKNRQKKNKVNYSSDGLVKKRKK